MDLKLPKMLCKDSKQHHVMFHELYSVSSLLCIARNVRFEIPYKVLYFETPFLMIFKYYAWASYGKGSRPVSVSVGVQAARSDTRFCQTDPYYRSSVELNHFLGKPLSCDQAFLFFCSVLVLLFCFLFV